jgi:4-hydroxybenzoate polyprenyltransferase
VDGTNRMALRIFIIRRLRDYARLMRLDRPIGIFLLLWPTLWALFIAGRGKPDPEVVTVFVLGVFLMRSAGCVINDFADQDIDRHVSRTRERPLTAQRVTSQEAHVLFGLLGLVAFGLVLLMNRLTIMLSIVGLLLAVSYPFMKRVTHLPQVYLGVAFGWAVPMAYAAQTGTLPPTAWLLFTATALWATAYDTMYAMVDRDDDIVIGVKSTAILFGEADRIIIGVIQLLMIVTLAAVGRQAGLGVFYTLGLLAASVMAAYQQYLIRNRDPDGCFSAFLNNNWFGFAIFTGIVLDYLSA